MQSARYWIDHPIACCDYESNDEIWSHKNGCEPGSRFQGFKKIKKYPKSDTAKRRQEKEYSHIACMSKKEASLFCFICILFVLSYFARE